jgi:hypothetical protein
MAGQRQIVMPFLLMLFLILPVYAHVPVFAGENTDITAALPIEKPTKSFVIYGHLHEAGEVAYYQLYMKPGERLSL